jgi:anaerobic selenocysteine-containing dehydrogenase
MVVRRREFLKLLGGTVGGSGLSACSGQWEVPDRLVEMALRGPGIETSLHSICRLCETGCGLTVRRIDGIPVGLKGNPRHPISRGGLCPVGQAGLEVLYAAGRLQGPLRRERDGTHVATTWEQALEEVANRLGEVRRAGGGRRIALLSDEPGQLFVELAERFMLAFGSKNIVRSGDPLSAAYALTQGIQRVPGLDLSQTDLVLSFGLDLFEDGPAPVHAIAAMVGSRATEERGSFIHVGTRLSPSAAKAEEHVPVQPGTHAALALGIAHVLAREGSYDREFVAEHTFGFDDWTDENGRRRMGFRRLLLERYYPDRAARLCGCDPGRIIRLARRFARADAPLAVAGGEAVWGSNATWTGMAVQALNALVGAFDRPGGLVSPPSIPFTPLDALPEPQPEASIFAEAKGADVFAVDPTAALAERVLDGSHPIDVLFIINSNAVHSSPAGQLLGQALERIPMVVALTSFRDETAAHADFILPTHVFLEAWHEATTPPSIPFSVMGLGQPVVEPLFDTRHAGDALLEIAGRVGGQPGAAMPWKDYVDYLKHRIEGLLVSGQGSVVSGSFEESWVQFLEERGWRFLEHNDLDQFWEDLVQAAGWWNPVLAYADWARLFQTPSGRYEFFSRTLETRLKELGARDAAMIPNDEEALNRGSQSVGLEAMGDEVCLPHYEPPKAAGEGEMLLMPFRTTTSRGDLGVTSPMVLEMFGYPVLSGWETWAELAPETAHRLHLEDGDRIAVESATSVFEAVVKIQAGAVPGVVHVPLGLGHDNPDVLAGGIGANPIRSLAREVDPISGNLTLTSTRVRLRLVRRRQHGGPAPAHGGHA